MCLCRMAMASKQKKTFFPSMCTGLSAANNEYKPACMTGRSVESESTYNRKQRNLACSLFPELTGEEESRGWEEGYATHERKEVRRMKGMIIKGDEKTAGGRDKKKSV